VLRDPRDVIVSCFRSRFAMKCAMFQFLTLEGAARCYDAVMSVAERSRERLPIDVHVVRYEDVRRQLAARGGARARLPRPALGGRRAEVHRNREPARDTYAQRDASDQTIYASSIGQWRHYEAELAPIRAILAPWARKFGYEDIEPTNF
jgi:hypothetical protein